MKKIINLKNKIRTALCSKLNLHSYVKLFTGFPAFSKFWYKVSVCSHCRKIKLETQKELVLKPAEYDFNKNYIDYNKKLSQTQYELAKQMVYQINRSCVKSNKASKTSTTP